MSKDSAERDFYDRQLRVLGKEAMQRMQGAKVLIVGLGGLGVEIAKNVILTGVHSVFLCDDTNVKWTDLSSNFYATEHDIGSNRVDSVLGQLKELNSYVRVSRVNTADLTADFMKESVTVAIYTDAPVVSLVKENEFCRATNTRFIACETRGLFACVFCDMGEKFTVFDENGEAMVENMILNITQENPALVTVHDDKMSHGLGLGDKVVFANVGGMESLNEMGEVEIDLGEGTDKHSFFIKVDARSMPPYAPGTGYCKQRRPPKVVQFLPLAQAITEPDVLDFDFSKFGWGRDFMHPMFRAVDEFLRVEGRSPRPYNKEDASKIVKITKAHMAAANVPVPKKGPEVEVEGEGETASSEPKKAEIPDIPMEGLYAELLSYTYGGNLNPLVSLIGGFAAQEVQKAVSGKFSPLHQWFYFDAVGCLDTSSLPLESEVESTNTRYDGQILVFGKAFQTLIARQRVFVVGSGALGCEYLKNLALIGVGTDEAEEGRVVVTDMDNVEVSNLNRQFLFRGHHVGKMKSTCAAESVRVMNPKLHCDALQDKLGPETEEVFDDRFWEGLDCVVNALDNITARLYVDGKCVYYLKPLIEAGTLGPKANTQVVLPHLTQSYGAERDPPEVTFPQCTLKNFPYKIDHTIAWARDLFEGYFMQEPKYVNQYLTNPDFVSDMRGSENVPAIKAIVQGVYRNLVTERPLNFDDCVAWARRRFEKHYRNDIMQLMFNFPKDHVTDSGIPFWTGSKRPPAELIFDITNEVHRMYVLSGANIRASLYGLKGEAGPGFDLGASLAKAQVDTFVPKSGVKIEVEEKKKDDDPDAMQLDADGFPIGGMGGWGAPPPPPPGQDDDEIAIRETLAKIPPPAEFAGMQLHEIAFEKDDDSNFHVDFMTACSNARAINYNIPTVDRHTTKGIAGRIIPAMVTSTALITGFGCLELYKIIRGINKIEPYRNAFINLALPLCAQSEPAPPVVMKYLETEYTEWDMFRVSLGRDVTIREFLEHFENFYKLKVTSLNYGVALVFATYLPTPGIEDRMVSEACFGISKTEPLSKQKYMIFVVLCEDDKGEDVDVPNVRYQFCDF